MPKPYSLDLRERVAAALEAGIPAAQVAVQFRMGVTTVYNYRKWHRSERGLAPRPHAGGFASGLDRSVLGELVREQNDATLEEYATRYEQRTGRRYSIAHLSRVLKEMKLSRKGRRSAPRSSYRPRLPRSA